jgi:hypothetical protein
MTAQSPQQRAKDRFDSPLLAPTLLMLAAAGVTGGCGSGGSSGGMSAPAPTPSGTTQVAVVMSSTANDQLSEYNITFKSLVLTSQTGKTFTVLPQSSAPLSEFIHVNALAEPLATASVPQDVYTVAAVDVVYAAFTCITYDPSLGLDVSTYAWKGPAATVNVPAPITVTGGSMVLALDLLVSKSAAYQSCIAPVTAAPPSWSVTPTFSLTPVAASAGPGSAQYGKVTALDGQVTSADASTNSVQLALPEAGRTLVVSSSSATVWQGVADAAALTAGTFVDLDGAIQPDGSVLATRIEIEDPVAVNVQRGPVVYVGNSTSTLDMLPRQGQGKDHPIDVEIFNFANAAFRTSGHFANLQALPFTPNFNAMSIVPGQSVYISSPTFNTVSPPSYDAVATTITLMPQTIDGTIVASSSSGNFVVYSVALAPYDLFAILAGQVGQTTLVTDPGAVQVYVDGSTQMLNSTPLAVGSTLRFYGLVFDDNATLRMDCSQINDGVPE